MSFPLSIFGQRVDDAPALLALVQHDAVDGGRLSPEREPPARWLARLHSEGTLERSLVVGLCAVLIQSGDSAVVAEGARLSRYLEAPSLGPVILAALQAHDTGTLMTLDPFDAPRSIEDSLLFGAVVSVDLTDEATRADLLEMLRNAGLPMLEVPILCKYGSVAELEVWLPSILADSLDTQALEHIAARLMRKDEAEAVILQALNDLPEHRRNIVLGAASGAIA